MEKRPSASVLALRGWPMTATSTCATGRMASSTTTPAMLPLPAAGGATEPTMGSAAGGWEQPAKAKPTNTRDHAQATRPTMLVPSRPPG